MKHRYFAAFLPVLILFSCSRTKPLNEKSPDVLPAVDDHTWYSFSNGSFMETGAPQDTPLQPERPWTEAVRISSASCAAGSGSMAPAAYALVNRTGILVFNDGEIQLYKDAALFGNRSADNLVFQNDTPLFSLYKSSFFNTTMNDSSQNDSLHPFLVQFDLSSHLAYPVISCTNLGLGTESEITDYVWDGSTFICSVKTETAGKVSFTYISVQPEIPLLSLSPSNASGRLLISQADRESFRSQKIPKPFTSAPDRLRQLLSVLPADTAFYVTCSTAGGHTPRSYISQKQGDDSTPLNAQALIADTYACALFSDGTMYISGALFDRHILNNGKTCALRLPRLPVGYEYASFTISGTTMYAAWEETAFYKVGRSGFIRVNLDKILYNN